MQISQKQTIRQLVRGIYELQKLRIQSGNRVAAAFRVKLGIQPGESEEKADKENTKILDQLRREYKCITDGIVELPTPSRFTPVEDGIIDSYSELMLVNTYMIIRDNEKKQFDRLDHALKGIPVYDGFLKGVKGIGPAIAGVILSEFDIYKAEYPSSLYRYAGLDCVYSEETGAWEGRSRKKGHLEEQTYTDSEGNPQTKMGITFNPFLKTKLLGVLGPSFLKVKDSPYGQIYRDYRNRLENHPDHKKKTKLHKHNMANRYAVKRFLADLYKNWRRIEGLPVAKEYHEEKLGITHKAA